MMAFFLLPYCPSLNTALASDSHLGQRTHSDESELRKDSLQRYPLERCGWGVWEPQEPGGAAVELSQLKPKEVSGQSEPAT